MNGRGFDTQRVLQGIQRASEVGLAPIKINAVVQRGVNDHTLVDLARHFKGSGHIVRFIEYMDVGNRNGWKLDQVVSAKEIVERIDAEMPLEPMESNYAGEVARPVPLPGRRGRNRRHSISYPAILRRLHAGPDLHRWPTFHLPFRHPGRRPEDAIAQRGHR